MRDSGIDEAMSERSEASDGVVSTRSRSAFQLSKPYSRAIAECASWSASSDRSPCGNAGAEPRHRGGIACLRSVEEVLRLRLELVEARPSGQAISAWTTPCVQGPWSADRQQEVGWCDVRGGFDPSRGPGRALEARAPNLTLGTSTLSNDVCSAREDGSRRSRSSPRAETPSRAKAIAAAAERAGPPASTPARPIPDSTDAGARPRLAVWPLPRNDGGDEGHVRRRRGASAGDRLRADEALARAAVDRQLPIARTGADAGRGAELCDAPLRYRAVSGDG